MFISFPPLAFKEIEAELIRRPLPVNKYRNLAGVGRSQAFGIVNRRCVPPDYSRHCWLRPYLYKLLLDFAAQYLPDFPYTGITVNDSFAANPHRDKGNVGDSVVVAFGDYTGGELRIHEGAEAGVWNVRHRGIRANFSELLHSVEPFEGRRFSLVFYTLKRAQSLNLPPPSVSVLEGEYVFKRGDSICRSLPHPQSGHPRKRKAKPAQNVDE